MTALDIQIAHPSTAAAQRARDRWNAVAKPIESLGLLEDAIVKIAALTGSEDIDISKRCVAILCADNGVVVQGVAQSGPEVTTIVAENIARGTSSICQMCAPVGIDCIAYDFGMVTPGSTAGIRNRCIRRGTCDITQGAAMTQEEATRAIEAGMQVVQELKDEGYSLIAIGEMGIGNTTTATAMACALTERSPEDLTGRGAGLSDDGLARKVAVIRKALEYHAPDASSPIDIISKLGGFDIAGLCGMCLGGAIHRVPIVVDGPASLVAALCAKKLNHACIDALLASHVSAEPAAHILLEYLGLEPIIHAEMRLGEGTGAACLVPLLDMALSLYHGTTFEECGLSPYRVNPR